MTFDGGIWERVGEQPRLKANVWVFLWAGKFGEMPKATEAGDDPMICIIEVVEGSQVQQNCVMAISA